MASMLTTVSTFATPDQPNPVLTNMFYHHTALEHAANLSHFGIHLGLVEVLALRSSVSAVAYLFLVPDSAMLAACSQNLHCCHNALLSNDRCAALDNNHQILQTAGAL